MCKQKNLRKIENKLKRKKTMPAVFDVKKSFSKKFIECKSVALILLA